MRNRFVSGTLAVPVFVALTLCARAADGPGWPGWRGPNRDGRSLDRRLLRQWPAAGPRRLWHATGIGEGFSGVAVADGRVYATGKIGSDLVISTFDENGNRGWRAAHGKAWAKNYPGSRATPTISQGRLYLLSGVGRIGCFDAASGRRVWAREMRDFGGRAGGWGYAESVLIARNLAIVQPGGQNCLVALDKSSGQTLWQSPGNGGPAHYSSAILAIQDRVPMIIAANGAGLYAVQPRDGKVLWQHDFSASNTANCPTPVYVDGFVFWATGYGKGGICLEVGTRGRQALIRERWRTRSFDCHHGGYVVDDGYIYGNHGGGWVCAELRSGRVMWEEAGVGKGSVCYADGMLYMFSENGGRVALAEATPRGYRARGGFRVQGNGPSWAHPAVVNGRLYLRYGDNLYCYKVAK